MFSTVHNLAIALEGAQGWIRTNVTVYGTNATVDLVLGLFFLLGTLTLLRFAGFREVPFAPHGPRPCPSCGYDLRATPIRCPECGVESAVSSVGNSPQEPELLAAPLP